MVEGVPAERISARTGTPVYVYSAAAVVRSFRALKSAFSRRDPLICYALKANPNRAVCRLLAGEGAGADIVSGGELMRALAAGFPAGRIVFSGVGKTAEEMALALRRGVRMINVESEEELEALSSVARRLKRRAPMAVRVNPDIDARTHERITTGLSRNKFGVGAGRALSLYRAAVRDRWLSPVGIHCHLGSQIRKTGPYVRAARVLLKLVDALSAEGVRLAELDMGGGMGAAPAGGLSPSALASAVLPLLRRRPDLRLVLEPGRMLVSGAGLLLTRVLYRKEGRRRFIIVDAGMNDFQRPLLYGAEHPIVPVRGPGRAKARADIAGPLCESSDLLAKGRVLVWPERGELLAVRDAGAYGFSMSSQYNSRPRAAEVLVSGDRFRVVRRRETVTDLVRQER